MDDGLTIGSSWHEEGRNVNQCSLTKYERRLMFQTKPVETQGGKKVSHCSWLKETWENHCSHCKQIRILLRENQQWLHPPATAKHPPSCSRETRKNDAIWCNDILWYSMIYYDILYCRWFIGDSRCSLHLCRGQIICTSVRYCSIKD